MTEFRTE